MTNSTASTLSNQTESMIQGPCPLGKMPGESPQLSKEQSDACRALDIKLQELLRKLLAEHRELVHEIPKCEFTERGVEEFVIEFFHLAICNGERSSESETDWRTSLAIAKGSMRAVLKSGKFGEIGARVLQKLVKNANWAPPTSQALQQAGATEVRR